MPGGTAEKKIFRPADAESICGVCFFGGKFKMDFVTGVVKKDVLELSELLDEARAG